ncbi:hypothetical protein [Argonema antarcticum]|uniref:hypothetical protein n=1 Tax=Argonema antarcticum TaxID=2942763 RepID=UPI0020122CB5|nr:hypothetical protein [Argonema antarcticum]MCL1470654.1 hypothetical protein [Argonema antarcticum A004/B2]
MRSARYAIAFYFLSTSDRWGVWMRCFFLQQASCDRILAFFINRAIAYLHS